MHLQATPITTTLFAVTCRRLRPASHQKHTTLAPSVCVGAECALCLTCPTSGVSAQNIEPWSEQPPSGRNNPLWSEHPASGRHSPPSGRNIPHFACRDPKPSRHKFVNRSHPCVLHPGPFSNDMSSGTSRDEQFMTEVNMGIASALRLMRFAIDQLAAASTM